MKMPSSRDDALRCAVGQVVNTLRSAERARLALVSQSDVAAGFFASFGYDVESAIRAYADAPEDERELLIRQLHRWQGQTVMMQGVN